MRRQPILLALLVLALVAACKPASAGGAVASPSSSAGGSGSVAASLPAASAASVVPVIISSQQIVGDNRFVFSFLDAKTNLPAADPNRTASVSFIAPGETSPGTAVPATFVWAIQGSRGEYIAHPTFASAGDWKAIFITQATGKSPEAIGVAFQVQLKGTVIGVGDPAPASHTPTLADVGGDVRMISSDPTPDQSFYTVSVDTALARRTPFILIFATPAFCQSAQCGPTLNHVKDIKATSPSSVAFINVEPYILKYTEGRLQPVLDASNQLQPVQSVTEWGLLTEPWIFAVDRTGVVRGSFEGVATDDELKSVIAAIAAS
jgi:hypothetical protein